MCGCAGDTPPFHFSSCCLLSATIQCMLCLIATTLVLQMLRRQRGRWRLCYRTRATGLRQKVCRHCARPPTHPAHTLEGRGTITSPHRIHRTTPMGGDSCNNSIRHTCLYAAAATTQFQLPSLRHIHRNASPRHILAAVTTNQLQLPVTTNQPRRPSPPSISCTRSGPNTTSCTGQH